MKTYKLKSKIYKTYKSRYIKISKNQLRVFDSLLNDGSTSKKYLDKYGKLRYSEHSGLLDFSLASLQRILVNSIPNISDKDDHEILLPENMPDAFDYEYMFHTHPLTPKIGSRIKDGILYEFPSVQDIFQFIEHHNIGKIQGSIIIAPEGLYLIKAINPNKKIKIKNENSAFNYISDKIYEIQDIAIEKYGYKFSKKKFYNKISQNKKFIKMYSDAIKKYGIKIHYKPRIKNKSGDWILNNLYLKVKPVE